MEKISLTLELTESDWHLLVEGLEVASLEATKRDAETSLAWMAKFVSEKLRQAKDTPGQEHGGQTQ